MLSRRMLLSAAAATAAAPAAFANTPATTGTPAYWSWFKHGEGVHKNWLVEQQGVPDWIRITPRFQTAAGQTRKIMVMYPRPSSAYDIAITKILDVFADKTLNLELTVTNFGLQETRGRAALAAAHDEHFDLIMTMGSEATAWMWDRYRGGVLPVLSVCSKDPVVLGQSPGYNKGSGTNFAFTSLNMPIEAQMAYVNELKPRLKNIAILVDSRNVSAVETQSKPVIDYLRPRGVRVMACAVDEVPAMSPLRVNRYCRPTARRRPKLAMTSLMVIGRCVS